MTKKYVRNGKSMAELAVTISTANENCEGDNWGDVINLCGDGDILIAQLEAQLDWVSVADEWPPCELVCVSYLVCDDINMWVDAWVLKGGSVFEWQSQRHVTHWRRQISLPKKEEVSNG